MAARQQYWQKNAETNVSIENGSLDSARISLSESRGLDKPTSQTTLEATTEDGSTYTEVVGGFWTHTSKSGYLQTQIPLLTLRHEHDRIGFPNWPLHSLTQQLNAPPPPSIHHFVQTNSHTTPTMLCLIENNVSPRPQAFSPSAAITHSFQDFARKEAEEQMALQRQRDADQEGAWGRIFDSKLWYFEMWRGDCKLVQRAAREGVLDEGEWDFTNDVKGRQFRNGKRSGSFACVDPNRAESRSPYILPAVTCRGAGDEPLVALRLHENSLPCSPPSVSSSGTVRVRNTHLSKPVVKDHVDPTSYFKGQAAQIKFEKIPIKRLNQTSNLEQDLIPGHSLRATLARVDEWLLEQAEFGGHPPPAPVIVVPSNRRSLLHTRGMNEIPGLLNLAQRSRAPIHTPGKGGFSRPQTWRRTASTQVEQTFDPGNNSVRSWIGRNILNQRTTDSAGQQQQQQSVKIRFVDGAQAPYNGTRIFTDIGESSGTHEQATVLRRRQNLHIQIVGDRIIVSSQKVRRDRATAHGAQAPPSQAWDGSDGVTDAQKGMWSRLKARWNSWFRRGD